MNKSKRTLWGALAAFAVVSGSVVNANESPTTQHPLSDPSKISMHEAYALQKVYQTAHFMAYRSDEDFDADVFVAAMQSDIYYPNSERILVDSTRAFLSQIHEGADIYDYAVICEGALPARFTRTAINLFNEDLGDLIISDSQIIDALEGAMRLPANMYAQLREAEYQQRLKGMNPDDAACKNPGEVIASAKKHTLTLQ